MAALLEVLQVVNLLVLPVLAFVVRIDRRMGQLDVLQSAAIADIEKLETVTNNLNHRLTILEYRP